MYYKIKTMQLYQYHSSYVLHRPLGRNLQSIQVHQGGGESINCRILIGGGGTGRTGHNLGRSSVVVTSIKTHINSWLPLLGRRPIHSKWTMIRPFPGSPPQYPSFLNRAQSAWYLRIRLRQILRFGM